MPKQYRHRKVTTNNTAYPMDGKVGSTCDIVCQIGKCLFFSCLFVAALHTALPPACPHRPGHVSDSPEARERTEVSPDCRPSRRLR
jgi:hypothetical protein